MKRSTPGYFLDSRNVWPISANASRHAIGVPRGAGFRSRQKKKSGSEKSRKRRTVEEWRDEEEPDDRAHVPHGRAEAGQRPVLSRRHELRQHRVVERLRRLV